MTKLALVQHLAGRVVAWLARPPEFGGWLFLGLLACLWCAGWYFLRETGFAP